MGLLARIDTAGPLGGATEPLLQGCPCLSKGISISLARSRGRCLSDGRSRWSWGCVCVTVVAAAECLDRM